MSLSYVDIEGGRLAVEVREPAGVDGADAPAPLVICSHSLGDERQSFYPLVDALAGAGYRVILADLRGHGASSTGFTRYGDEATALDLGMLLKRYGASQERPAVLIGSSMSSAAATVAAGQWPEAVAGLVLIGPFLRQDLGPIGQILFNMLFWWPWGPLVWRLYAATLWPGLPEAERKQRAARTTAQLQTDGRWPAFQATVAGADHNGAVTPWLAAARHQPALVVVGEKDPDWTKPIEEAAWVASQFPSKETTTVLVPEAGHAPMLERPAVVTPEVLRFLGTLRQGTTFRSSRLEET